MHINLEFDLFVVGLYVAVGSVLEEQEPALVVAAGAAVALEHEGMRALDEALHLEGRILLIELV